jgi:hypothetical protein
VLALAVASACSHSATTRPLQSSPPRAPAPHSTPAPPASSARVAPPIEVQASATPITPPLAAIYSASATPRVAHAGDTIVWNVRTSRAIASVTAKSAGFTIPLEKRGPGVFGLSFVIPPQTPSFFHGTYAVTLEARTATGASATSQLSLKIE